MTSLQLPVGIVSDLVIHTLQIGSHYHLESSDCPTLWFAKDNRKEKIC